MLCHILNIHTLCYLLERKCILKDSFNLIEFKLRIVYFEIILTHGNHSGVQLKSKVVNSVGYTTYAPQNC